MLTFLVEFAYLCGIVIFLRFSIIKCAASRAKKFNSYNFVFGKKSIAWDNYKEISIWDDYNVRNRAKHLNSVFRVKLLWLSVGSIIWPLTLCGFLVYILGCLVLKLIHLLPFNFFKSWISQGEERTRQRIQKEKAIQEQNSELEKLINSDDEIRRLNEV